MSTRPHIVLSWPLRRTRLPLLPFRCVHCHSSLANPGDGRFRVDANGNLLDIRLLVACASCDRSRRNRLALERDSCWRLFASSPPESPWAVQLSVTFGGPVPRLPERLITQGSGDQPRRDRSPRQDRCPAEAQNSQGLLVPPAVSRRRGPEPGRAARWPFPGLHHATVRARSLMSGRERAYGPARYRRRR